MNLTESMDRLAQFEPSALPVISLYLNLQPDRHGRDSYELFVRRQLQRLARTFAPRSPEGISFDRDAERIGEFLENRLRPSANGLALFACAGEGEFFEALQLDTPIALHQCFVGDQPHLYTLARLSEQYRRYAAVVADTNFARLFVFGLNRTVGQEEVRSAKTSRGRMGGWAQSRYQRAVRNQQGQHAGEIIEALDRMVREEEIEHIILAGDEVIVPALKRQMPAPLAAKVVEVLRLDIRTPEREILAATLEALRAADAEDDAHHVQRLLSEYRAGGLAAAGLEETLEALQNGQVEELLLTARLRSIHGQEDAPAPAPVFTADELVTRARQTAAEVRFIEDPELLAGVGGVGAFLRYRLLTAS